MGNPKPTEPVAGQPNEASCYRSVKGVSGVLVAIPVFNERKHVDDVLGRVMAYHPHVLVVDDGSSDGTAERLAAWPQLHRITHARNLGYGQSLIDAFAYADRAGFEWVLTMDCDEQHEPEMIPAFLDLIREDRWDLVSGSRYRTPHEDDNEAPQDRAAINACLTRLLNDLYGLGLTDSFCGFKAHRVSAMRRLSLTETGYAFPMQLWPQVVHAGLRVTEMAVRRIYVDPNRSFGARLDQPLVRLSHYLEVLSGEHERLFGATVELPDAASLLGGASVKLGGKLGVPVAEREEPVRGRACCGCR